MFPPEPETPRDSPLRFSCQLSGGYGILVATIPIAMPVHHPASSKVNCTQGLQHFRRGTQNLRSIMGFGVYPVAHDETRTTSCRYQRWIVRRWRNRYNSATRQYNNPPHYSAWMCIHRYEGSWSDPNAPFYGGLQMDITFQQLYGDDLLRTKGTANYWTPLEQIWVAERAYRSGRGFYPWPNSARYCGLI